MLFPELIIDKCNLKKKSIVKILILQYFFSKAMIRVDCCSSLFIVIFEVSLLATQYFM